MAFFNFFLKKWEHSRAKIYNTLQPIRPSIHPLRRLIIDWQSEVEMAIVSLQPIGDTPVKALANRSLSRQPKLSLPWRGRLHTPCSFTWVPSKHKQCVLPFKCNFWVKNQLNIATYLIYLCFMAPGCKSETPVWAPLGKSPLCNALSVFVLTVT